MGVGLGVEMGSGEDDEISTSEEVTTGVDVVTSVDSTTSDVAEEITNSTSHTYAQVQIVHFIVETLVHIVGTTSWSTCITLYRLRMATMYVVLIRNYTTTTD